MSKWKERLFNKHIANDEKKNENESEQKFFLRSPEEMNDSCEELEED